MLEPSRATLFLNFFIAALAIGGCTSLNKITQRNTASPYAFAFVLLIVTFVVRNFSAFQQSDDPGFSYYIGYEIGSIFWPLLVVFFCGMLNRHFTMRLAAEQRESVLKLQAERERTLAAQRESALKLDAQKLEHLAEIGTMTSGLNHELGNIITPFKLEVDDLSTRKFDDEDVNKSIGILKRSVGSAERLAEGLRNVSKPVSLKISTVELSHLFAEVISSIKCLPTGEGVQFETNISPNAGSVEADEEWLNRVLHNLIKNACEAIQAQPERKVTVSTFAQDNAIRIDISDNGPGMSQETVQKLFQPFFTTKGSQGTGLGLFMCRKAINAHGGKLELKSEVGKGTTFSILIPKNKPV